MSNTDTLSIILGFLAPIIISAINQRHWSNEAKLLTAFGICLVLGGGISFLTGELDGKDVMGAVGVTFTAAALFYKLYFKNTKWNEILLDIASPAQTQTPVETELTDETKTE